MEVYINTLCLVFQAGLVHRQVVYFAGRSLFQIRESRVVQGLDVPWVTFAVFVFQFLFPRTTFPFLLFFSCFNDFKPLSPTAAVAIVSQQHWNGHPQEQRRYCRSSDDCFWYQSFWWPLSTVSTKNDWFKQMPEGRLWRSHSFVWFEDASVWLTEDRRASWANGLMCFHSFTDFMC